MIVNNENANTRLDHYLANNTEFSRSKITNLIKEGKILVNGKNVKTGYLIKENDIIEINYEEEELKAEPEKMDLDIVYEDNDVIVVNKANKVVVHPACGNKSGTLVNGLLYHSKNLSSINGEFRPGTPNLPGIVTFSKAVRLATEDLNKKEDKIRKYNQKIVEHLKKYPKILINNTNNSIPNIVNISLMDIKPETFVHALEKHEVYVSSNTACASGKISNAVLGIYLMKGKI